MAKHAIDTTDVTRPDGVEGVMLNEERVYDKDSGTFPISQVHIWIEYSVSDVVVEEPKKISIGDGMIGRAVDKAYDVALAAEIADQKVANPAFTDEEATDAARLVVTKKNTATIWSQLQDAVKAGGTTDVERAALADTIVQDFLSKKVGAASWGIRLLKFAYNGKGL